MAETPSWHWTKQPNAEAIKAKLVKTLRSDNWTGKKRDPETLRKLNEGKERWIASNPEEYKESRIKATRHLLGETNPNWKGGISKAYKEHNRINNSRWFATRKVMLARCPECAECGSDSKLVVHHIIHWDISHDDSEDNLMVLCRSCHIKVHGPRI